MGGSTHESDEYSASRIANLRLTTLAASLRDGVLVEDSNRRIAIVNSKFCELFGIAVAPELLVGASCADSAAAASLLFAEPEKFTRRIPELLEEGRASTGEVLELADGRVFERDYIPVADEHQSPLGSLWIYRDVTARIREERRLRNLSRAVEQCPASVLITDPQGRIEYANPKFTQLTRYSPEEVLGRNLSFLQSGERREDESSRMSEVLERGVEWQGDLHNRKKNGELYWERASISPIRDESGSIAHFVTVSEDITERQRMASALEREQDRLRVLWDLADQAQKLTQNEVCDRALELAVKFAGSEVGYLHLVNEDQKTICLRSWNRKAREKCTAVFDSHYPIEQAGVWADCARTRRPAMHNDFPNLEGRKGVPDGHIQLQRHLSVPVIDGGRLVMILGVGNKSTDYDEEDVIQLKLIAGELSKIVARKMAEDALRES